MTGYWELLSRELRTLPELLEEGQMAEGLLCMRGPNGLVSGKNRRESKDFFLELSSDASEDEGKGWELFQLQA